MIIVWATVSPRSAIISTRSQKTPFEAQVSAHAKDDNLTFKITFLQILQARHFLHRIALTVKAYSLSKFIFVPTPRPAREYAERRSAV
jgi:hypothetical protein